MYVHGCNLGHLSLIFFHIIENSYPNGDLHAVLSQLAQQLENKSFKGFNIHNYGGHLGCWRPMICSHIFGSSCLKDSLDVIWLHEETEEKKIKTRKYLKVTCEFKGKHSV